MVSDADPRLKVHSPRNPPGSGATLRGDAGDLPYRRLSDRQVRFMDLNHSVTESLCKFVT
jgi:hypothetical protein